MKSKIRLIILACFIAGVAVTGFHMAQNNQRMGVSLADIAVMAMADGEGGGTCTVSLACSIVNPAQNYISCTGTVCSRNAAERWVECDGNRTYC